jgi:hypothetical protein
MTDANIVDFSFDRVPQDYMVDENSPTFVNKRVFQIKYQPAGNDLPAYFDPLTGSGRCLPLQITRSVGGAPQVATYYPILREVIYNAVVGDVDGYQEEYLLVLVLEHDLTTAAGQSGL